MRSQPGEEQNINYRANIGALRGNNPGNPIPGIHEISNAILYTTIILDNPESICGQSLESCDYSDIFRS